MMNAFLRTFVCLLLVVLIGACDFLKGSFTAAGSGEAGGTRNTENCLVTKKLAEKSLALQSIEPKKCLDPAQFRCQMTKYGPDLVSGSHEESICTDFNGSQSCLQIPVVTENTSSLVEAGGKPEDFLAGAKHNRVFFECHLPDHRSFEAGTLFTSSDLSTALEETKNQCLILSNLNRGDK